MIPSFLKAPLFGSSTVAIVSSALPAIDPEVFKSVAMSWVSTGATVFAALVGAVSVAISLVFGVLKKFDEYAAERAARRAQSPPVTPPVDTPPQG